MAEPTCFTMDVFRQGPSLCWRSGESMDQKNTNRWILSGRYLECTRITQGEGLDTNSPPGVFNGVVLIQFQPGGLHGGWKILALNQVAGKRPDFHAVHGGVDAAAAVLDGMAED